MTCPTPLPNVHHVGTSAIQPIEIPRTSSQTRRRKMKSPEASLAQSVVIETCLAASQVLCFDGRFLPRTDAGISSATIDEDARVDRSTDCT